MKNPCFSGGFPRLFPKQQGKEEQGARRPIERELCVTSSECHNLWA